MGFDETKKQSNLSIDQVLEKLLYSLINSKEEEIETKCLDQSIKNTGDPNEAIKLVKKIDKMIKCTKNNGLTVAYHQGKVFQKFKMNNKFVSAVIEFEKS